MKTAKQTTKTNQAGKNKNFYTVFYLRERDTNRERDRESKIKNDRQ